MFFDSHGHLDDRAFDADRYEVAARFSDRGVVGMIDVGSSAESLEKAREIAERCPNIFFSAGIHPSECGDLDMSFLEKIKDLYLNHPKCVAIGEIGLDYHYDDVPKEIQREWFEAQCALAKELDAPVIIHDREAHAECLEMVKKYGNSGVFHCFSGSAEMAKELVKMGFYISFTGVLTFKNARRAIEAAEVVPLDRLMIETDCPYMAPEPHRGTRNDPTFVPIICETLARIKGVSVEEAAKATFENAKRLFGFEIN